MAPQRLGHRGEALHYLERLRNDQLSSDTPGFLLGLHIRFPRGEAEALILDDPIFPADPFAD